MKLNKQNLSSQLLKNIKGSRSLSIIIAHFILFNIFSGVAVAGIGAGKVFNTFPKMNNGYYPSDYWRKELGIRNYFENCSNTQFNHRMAAYMTYASAAFGFLKANNIKLPLSLTRGFGLLFLLTNI